MASTGQWILAHLWPSITGGIVLASAMGGAMMWWLSIKKRWREEKAQKEAAEIPRVLDLMKKLFRDDAREQGRNLGGGMSIHPAEWFIPKLPHEKPDLVRKAHMEWIAETKELNEKYRRK